MRGSTILGLILGMQAGVATGAAPIEAQQINVAVHMGQAVDEAGNGHAGVTLSPTLAWSGANAVAALSGQVTALASLAVIGTVSGGSRVQAVAAGPLSILVGAEAMAVASEGGYRAGAAVLRPVARIAAGGFGLEVGPQLGSGGSRIGTRTNGSGALTGLLDRPISSAGETHYRVEGGWSVDGWASRGPAWVRIGRRALTSGDHSWEEWNVESGAALEPFTVTIRSGVRDGYHDELFFAGAASVQVSDRVAVALEGGRSPSSTLLGHAGGTYGTVGASWSIGGTR